MSDNQELEAFLRTEKVELPPWESREWLHYPDVNQGSYQNQINFDGQTARNHWQCLSDAYVVIPISVSSSTSTAYTSTTVIAPKDGGIDNLITGISVGDVQSTWINESSGQTPLINSLRKTLEHDMEWLDNESSESMYTEAKLNSKTKEGMTRSINFMLTNYYGPSMFGNTSPSISQLIS